MVKKISFIKYLIILLAFLYGLIRLEEFSKKVYLIEVEEIYILSEAQKLFKEEKYEEAKLISCYLSSSDDFSHQIRQKSEEICKKSKDILDSWYYKTKKCVYSAIKGIPDDLISFSCVLLSDMTVFGDVRDILKEIVRYFKNEEVDEFMLGLSALGIASPIFDFLKILKKSSALNDSLARFVLKDKNLAKGIWEMGINWNKQAGAQSFFRVLRLVKTPQEFHNLYRYTKTYGPEMTYIAVTRTNGKILKEYKPFILYTSNYHLFRVGLKDFIGKDGYLIMMSSLINLFKENFGKYYVWLISLFIFVFYLIVSNIFPPINIRMSIVFGFVVLVVSLFFLLRYTI